MSFYFLFGSRVTQTALYLGTPQTWITSSLLHTHTHNTRLVLGSAEVHIPGVGRVWWKGRWVDLPLSRPTHHGTG